MIDLICISLWWLLLLIIPYVPRFKKICYSITLCCLIVAGLLTAHNYYKDMYPAGIISEDIIVRVGADESYGTCGTLHTHDKVVVCGTVGTWKNVQKIDSMYDYITVGTLRGWIPQEYVVNIS